MNATPAETLKGKLIHTWPHFFARHGNLTAVQIAAMPPILAGQSALIMAATAAGKTEAALAPLLERHLWDDKDERRPGPALRLLLICPTRALVRNLYERLAGPLAALHIPVAMKSGDTGPVSATAPPAVLITTPESVDSLLTRTPRLFITLAALVLDEIHLFDHTVRGDQVRCLLQRIAVIQHYHAQQTGQAQPSVQRVALSATVADPAGVVERYLRGATQPTADDVAIIQIPGRRPLRTEIQALHSLDDLVAALARRSAGQGVRKSLIFCNTRNEVEQVAAYLRQEQPYATDIFVHYSNLDPQLRREVEERFAAASVAICVSSSTLELGIDIGNIDDVVLVGPPPTDAAFLQRIGRGGRRRQWVQALCLARSPLEEIRFRALIALASADPAQPANQTTQPLHYHFRPSVLVQQIFSLLKQSPLGSLRLADLRRIAPPEVADAALPLLLRHLARRGFLQTGRPGEWRPAAALDPLLEEHEIYSNIGADPLARQLVDAHSGRTLAQTGQLLSVGETLLLGGQTLEVVWRDQYRIGVRPRQPTVVDHELRFHTAPFAIPLPITQAISQQLHLPPHQLCLVYTTEATWLFHFWGDLYGALLAAVLQEQLEQADPNAIVTPRNELCLSLPGPLAQLPAWQPALVQRQLRRLLPRLEPYLGLGRFHQLLPPTLADEAVLAQFDLPRFAKLYQAATVSQPGAGLRTQLLALAA